MYLIPDERHSSYSCLSAWKCKQRGKVVVCSSDMERILWVGGYEKSVRSFWKYFIFEKFTMRSKGYYPLLRTLF